MRRFFLMANSCCAVLVLNLPLRYRRNDFRSVTPSAPLSKRLRKSRACHFRTCLENKYFFRVFSMGKRWRNLFTNVQLFATMLKTGRESALFRNFPARLLFFARGADSFGLKRSKRIVMRRRRTTRN